MAGLTEHFGFQWLRPGEQFATNDGKFLDEDRKLVDRLLHQALTGHQHSGEAASVTAPTLGPTLSLDLDEGGTIPAGTRVYYRYTWVDERGNETTPSPIAFIDTPEPIASPGAPVPVSVPTGGSLLPGSYFYVLSAYSPVNTKETRATAFANVVVPVGTSTNRNVLTLPPLPAGAVGYNVYRRAPGGSQYLYIASIDMSAATPPSTWTDDGSHEEDCDRTLPASNTTLSANAIRAALPGASPSVQPGLSWKLYRTYVVDGWGSSLLHHVVEESAPGVREVSWLDLGEGTITGRPPDRSQIIAQPSKINLEDAAQVSGRLPLSSISAFPFTVTFNFEGQLVEMTGTSVWPCMFPKFRIMGIRAALGRFYSPAAQDVIVDVNRGSGATPTFSSLFTDQDDRPRVPVGHQVGPVTVPADFELLEGDVLTFDIDQTGEGATPTDRDLTLTIFGFAYGWTDPASMDW